MFAAFENLRNNGNVSWAWDTIREDIKISAKDTNGHCEPKHNKQKSNEELKVDDHWKQATLQWLQDPSEVYEGNLSNVRREASRHFRNKTKLMSWKQTVRIRT
jgi:hypothetical protein